MRVQWLLPAGFSGLNELKSGANRLNMKGKMKKPESSPHHAPVALAFLNHRLKPLNLLIGNMNRILMCGHQTLLAQAFSGPAAPRH